MKYEQVLKDLEASPKTWLVTGAAGFIGSHLVENLLKAKQKVIGLDNFATGYQKNVDLFSKDSNYKFVDVDVSDAKACADACKGVDYVLHQAALGSVPRSMEDPISSNTANVDGFLNIINAAKDNNVKGFVYASSSSVYGDDPELPKVESKVGKVLSPYAATKKINEIYAQTYASAYGFSSIGLRYFNVFGPRQDPNGAYAAVIPKWVDALRNGKECKIFGDGTTSRDFCYVTNVVQANILSALHNFETPANLTFNVALGNKTSLTELYFLIRDRVAKSNQSTKDLEPKYEDFRKGDIKHSLANTSAIQDTLGYVPTVEIDEGLDTTVAWFLN